MGYYKHKNGVIDGNRDSNTDGPHNWETQTIFPLTLQLPGLGLSHISSVLLTLTPVLNLLGVTAITYWTESLSPFNFFRAN